jgi:hypothetical protein
MAGPPRLLTACTASSLTVLRSVFFGHAILIPSFTTGQAIQRLAVDIALVLCTDDFELNPVLDLVRKARAAFPNIPVVCCRAFGPALSPREFEATKIMTNTVGAADFVALPNLCHQYGVTEGVDRFRHIVMSHAAHAS